MRSQERQEEARRGQEKPREARGGQERPGEARRGQGRPGEARRRQERPGEARGGQEKPGSRGPLLGGTLRQPQKCPKMEQTCVLTPVAPNQGSGAQEKPGTPGGPGEARRGQERPQLLCYRSAVPPLPIGISGSALLSIGCVPLTDRSWLYYRSGPGAFRAHSSMYGAHAPRADGGWTEAARRLDGGWTEAARKWADPSNHFATVLRSGEDELSTDCQ